MSNAQEKFLVPLIDLGREDQRYSGVLTPEVEIGLKKTGITDQFLEDAQTYHTKYSNAEHWLNMFKRIFDSVGKPSGTNLSILDIGTGSGVNTIEPCLALFPDCQIIGTDLSPQLLTILRRFIVTSGLESRVACVCTDAMRNFFKPECFDVVIGGSILHHLLDPIAALAAAHRALKPGGIAIFIEPFEGYSLIRAAFSLITEKAARDEIHLNAEAFMRAMMRDIEARAGSDKSSSIFQHLDDKWLFTRTYLQRASSEAGFGSISFVPMFEPENQYRQGASWLLRMGGFDPQSDLPEWGWQIIDTFDRSLSDDFKAEAALECGIVLRR